MIHNYLIRHENFCSVPIWKNDSHCCWQVLDDAHAQDSQLTKNELITLFA